MKLKDHFLSQEEFSLIETERKGVWKTQPVPENLAPYYESKDYISHHQDSGSLKEFVYKFLQTFNLLYKRNIIIEHVGKGATLLDYGCGAGEFLKKMEADFTTVGFEPNANARNSAAKKLNKTQLLTDLAAIENDSLDAITLWHVFEHLPDPDETLEIFYSKLKSTGKLIIAIPNPSSHDAKHYREFWAAYDVPRHLFHYSRNGMLAKMNSEKWMVKKTHSLLLDAFYISALSEKYQKSSFFWFKGFVRGAISNIKALKTREHSSVIYIIGKRKIIGF